MNTLVEWIGKTEDIQIMYDAGIAKNSLLLAANDGITANFPAIIYPLGIRETIFRRRSSIWRSTFLWPLTRKRQTLAEDCSTISGTFPIISVWAVSCALCSRNFPER